MGLTLVQILLFRYLRGNSGLSLDARSTDGSSRAFSADQGVPAEPRRDDPDDGRRCPECGAVNTGEFTFCRNCVAPLSS